MKRPKIMVFVGELLVPSGEGATHRFLNLFEQIVLAGFELVCVHAYAGWSDAKALSRLPYNIILVHPDDFYHGVDVLRMIVRREDPLWLQSKEPEFLASLVTRALIPESAGLVFDCHDVHESNHATDISLRHREEYAASVSDLVFCISHSEANLLKAFPSAEHVHFIPPTLHTSDTPLRPVKRQGNRIGFLGHMYYEPNADALRWFASHVFPSVLDAVPSASCHIIGHSPKDLVQELETENIHFHGYVADLSIGLSDLDLGISVVHSGTGSRMKVLDYLKAGLPVLFNARGVGGMVDSMSSKCESAEQLGLAAIELLKDEALRYSEYHALRSAVLVNREPASVQHKLGRLLSQKPLPRWRHLAESRLSLSNMSIESFQSKLARSSQPWREELIRKGRLVPVPQSLVSRGEFLYLSK